MDDRELEEEAEEEETVRRGKRKGVQGKKMRRHLFPPSYDFSAFKRVTRHTHQAGSDYSSALFLFFTCFFAFELPRVMKKGDTGEKR